MTDQQAASKFIKDTLTAAGALTALLAAPPTGMSSSIYRDVAPQEAAKPYVVYQFLPGGDDDTLQGGITTVMSNLPVQVKVVTDGLNSAPADAIYEQVHTALQAVSATIGGFLINCVRISTLPSMPVFDRKSYRQAGGRYLIHVRPSI